MTPSPTLSLILKGLLVIGLVYAIFVLLAWRFQERLAFPGPSAPLPPPADEGLPDGTVATVITSDGVTLRGWYLPPNPAPDPGHRAAALIWFYGNMETVAGIAPILRAFRPAGTGVLVLDYRGYGQSEGRATEDGLYRDAEAAWAFLVNRPEVDSTRIAVYGRSLGSAVALYLATERPVRAVVLDSPFSSGRDMAETHYAILPTRLLRLRLNNVGRAERLTAPLLVVHGADDQVAPVWMGRTVATVGRAEEFVVLEGSGHNDTYLVGGQPYREKVHAFLARHLRSTSARGAGS